MSESDMTVITAAAAGAAAALVVHLICMWGFWSTSDRPYSRRDLENVTGRGIEVGRMMAWMAAAKRLEALLRVLEALAPRHGFKADEATIWTANDLCAHLNAGPIELMTVLNAIDGIEQVEPGLPITMHRIALQAIMANVQAQMGPSPAPEAK
jgi:hypothetical protein